MDAQFPPLQPADYDRALELWPTRLVQLARNIGMVPFWLPGEDRFWFREELATGHAFRLVDAATGAISPAFDHDAVARLIEADAAALPFTEFEYSDGQAIEFREGKQIVHVDISAGTVSRCDAPLPALISATGDRLILRDFNLWVEDADGNAKPLTQDGEEFFGWGQQPDADLTRIARNRGLVSQRVPSGCVWSPDATRLLVPRIDERHIEPYAFLESTPLDGDPRPKVHTIRLALSGESDRPIESWFVLDMAGKAIPVAPLPDGLEILPSFVEPMWSPDGKTVYAAAVNIDCTLAALIAIDADSGAIRIIHRERSATFIDFNTYVYNKANITLLADRGEMLWFSESDGWGHLYAIDLASGAIRQITAGDWLVLDVLAITDRQIFFSGGGREPGRNPYYRHLYRVDLDGSGPNAGLTLLTPDDADHGFSGDPTDAIARSMGRRAGLSPVSPSARYFIDSVSTVDRPPVYILRDADGREIAEILRADISALEATGWLPPEMFTSKAADGDTDLYGMLIKPRAFAERASWPVLERIYGGPQINVYPRSFRDGLNGAFTHCLNATAEMGFVVAVLDGPGTPSRSKRFHDLTYSDADRWGIRHHRAALEGAAANRPWMDLSKVGISGHSFGGFGTAMALLLEPDFYKVGVSSAGMYDVTHIYGGPIERYLGHAGKTSPTEQPERYARVSPSHIADRLTGDLMLVYGDLDENAPPAGLLAFAKALSDAGKGYDMLYLPNTNHNFVPFPYYQKRMWDYFIEHIQGRRSLRHHKLDVLPGQRMFI